MRDVVERVEGAPNLPSASLATPALLVDLDILDANEWQPWTVSWRAMASSCDPTSRPIGRRRSRSRARGTDPRRDLLHGRRSGGHGPRRRGPGAHRERGHRPREARATRTSRGWREGDNRGRLHRGGGPGVDSGGARRSGGAVLIDMDILIHRCGVASAAEAVALARRVATSGPGWRGRPHGRRGQIRPSVPDRAERIAGAYALLAEARQALGDAGLGVETVSAAGTSTIPRRSPIRPSPSSRRGSTRSWSRSSWRWASPSPAPSPSAPRSSAGTPIASCWTWGGGASAWKYGPPTPIGVAARSVNVSDEHTTLSIDGVVPALGSQVRHGAAQVPRPSISTRRSSAERGEVVATWPIAARGASR